MIVSITLNPSVDHALFLEKLKLHDTNRVQRVETDAGGKGVNLSRVAAELGAETLATGFLGGGPGDYVESVLNRQGVRHRFVRISQDTRTNFSVEDESDDPPTTFNAKGPVIQADEWEELLEVVRDISGSSSWVTLGGSLPQNVPVEAFRILAELACSGGCKVALDADGEPLEHGLKAKPFFLKPNDKEASRLLGRPVSNLEEAVSAAKEIREIAGGEHRFVVLSRGEHGAVLAHEAGVLNGIAPEVEVRSTIGSGDSMVGGILWALESGKSLEEAFRYGMAAGAATATTDGTEIARRPVIERLLPEVRIEKVEG